MARVFDASPSSVWSASACQSSGPAPSHGAARKSAAQDASGVPSGFRNRNARASFGPRSATTVTRPAEIDQTQDIPVGLRRGRRDEPTIAARDRLARSLQPAGVRMIMGARPR